MKSSLSVIALVALSMLLSIDRAGAAGFGWPSKKTSSKASKKSFARRMPSMVVRPLKATGQATQTTITKVRGGTKRLMTSAKNTLTFKKKRQRKPVSGQTGSYRFRKDRPDKKGFFRWFRDDPPEPQTAQEWIGLERPGL